MSTTQTAVASPDQSSRSKKWPRIVGGLLAVAAIVVLARSSADRIPQVLRAIDGLGPWAAVAYIGLYTVAAVAWVPGSVLTLASGAIFGLLKGTAYTIVGATLGASMAFLVARHVARKPIERRLGDTPKIRAVDEAIAKDGAKIVFLIRLSPVFPFNALNYALGLTRVKFRDYVPASALGIIPGTFMYVYAGHTAGQIAAGAAGAGPSGWGRWVLMGVGLLATVAVTVIVTRAARRALESSTGLGDEGTAATNEPGTAS